MKSKLVNISGLLTFSLLSLLCWPICAAEVRTQAQAWALQGATIDPAYGGPKGPVTVVVKRGVIACVSSTCDVPAHASRTCPLKRRAGFLREVPARRPILQRKTATVGLPGSARIQKASR